MSASVFNHPILAGLFGDEEIESYLTPAADIDAMLAFEAALAEADVDAGLIGASSATAITARTSAFAPDLDALAAGMARDGVVVPALLKQLRSGLSEPVSRDLHKGATSQDVMDASMAMRFQGISFVIDRRLEAVVDALAGWRIRDGERQVMAHTRMQAARRVPFSRKLASWSDPLVRCRLRREEIAPRAFALRMGGATGDRSGFGPNPDALCDAVAARLKLWPAPTALHCERDGIVDLADWLSLVTGALGKFGADVTLALQSEVAELALAGGGGSSAMPHKNNPVGAELLVTLARFNATLVSGLHHSLVHENERSGAAWSLEWMLLPQMAMATGAATRTALDLLGQLSLTAADGKDGAPS